MEINTNIVYSKLDTAIKLNYRYIVGIGGTRSGKTYNILIYLILYAMQHPNILISVVRATFPALRASALRDFIDITNDIGIKVNANKAEGIYTFPNGSQFEFFSTDAEQKLRGRKRNILFMNEANEVGNDEKVQLFLRTTNFIICDCNPSFPQDHWLAILSQQDTCYTFKSTWRDNPFLGQTTIDEIESLKFTNPTLYEILSLGNFAKMEGAVFENWDIVTEVPSNKDLRIAVGLDWGYSNDPCAIVKCYIDLNRKEVWLEELCYQTHMFNSDIISKLRQYNIDCPIVADSSEGKSIAELSRAGFHAMPANKELGKPGARIKQIYWLQGFKFHIIKGSNNLVKEISGYHWLKNNSTGKQINEVNSDNDHCIDSIRYCCYTLYGSGKVTIR